MSLKESFEKSGNWLFRYRSYIPVIFLLTAFPVIAITPVPVFSESLTCLSVILSLMGVGVRAYTIGTTPRGTSGRNTSKQVAETLNTSGIYSLVRHPLYLGNYMMWAGLALFAYNIWYFIIVSLVFWIYYERIMFAEEAFLQGKFGEVFQVWASQVPAFFPRFKGFRPAAMPFSLKSVLRREYSGIFALTLVYFLMDYSRILMLGLPFMQRRASAIVLLVTGAIALLLRNLKHHTSLLNESDRS